MFQSSFYHMRSLPLDCLRIVLCLLVVDYHYGKFFHAGPTAVIGFFVLSGYFLEKEFEKGEHLNLPLFFKKKAINLLPEYLTVSIPCLLIALFFPQHYHVDFSQAREAPFTLIQLFETANVPSWFLTNLFLFIAFAPIFFCFHQTKWGIALAFVLASTYHILLHEAYGDSMKLYTAAQSNISFFLGGMLARQLYNHARINYLSRSISLALAATCFFIIGSGAGVPKLVPCFLFMLLIPTLHLPTTPVPQYLRFIVWLSSLTYAMYLFHAPVKRVCTLLIHQMGEFSEQQIHTPLVYGLFLLLTILASALFQHAKARLIRCFQ